MKKNKGITIITLVITIVILLILSAITIETGGNIIEQSKIENLKTNMLLIKVKGKEYLENANFKLGTKIETVSEEERNKRIETAKSELKGEDITNNISEYENIIKKEESQYIFYYKLNNQNLIEMGLTNVKSDEKEGWFIIKYDIQNIIIEVYNTKGIGNEEGRYYSLNQLENLII